MSKPNVIDTIACKDEASLQMLGEDLALALRKRDLVTLEGDLGAGKTTLARALIRACAHDPYLEVPSPTFTLVQSYTGFHFGDLAHMDLYRLEDPSELEELGLDEALQDGVVLVEWPLKGGLDKDKASLTITIEVANDDTRHVSFSGKTDILDRVARTLEIRTFLKNNNRAQHHRRHFFGDASARSYETVFEEVRENPSILMNAPTQPDGPPIRDGKPYSQIARLAEGMTAFVGVDMILAGAGFKVPALQAMDLDAGLLVLENLGAAKIIDESRVPISDRYHAAVETLAEIHKTDWPKQVKVAPGITHVLPPYDRDAMLIEVELLPQWYAEHAMGRTLTKGELEQFNGIWSQLIDLAQDAEKSIVLRDYHSPNIIWCDGASGTNRTGLIDFQDAVIGPAAYDVASLVQDARVDVSAELEAELTDHYCSCRNGLFDEYSFRQSLALMSAQRATKVLGIFVRLSKRDGKNAYLAHLPRIEAYLKRACTHPSLAELQHWVETVLKV